MTCTLSEDHFKIGFLGVKYIDKLIQRKYTKLVSQQTFTKTNTILKDKNYVRHLSQPSNFHIIRPPIRKPNPNHQRNNATLHPSTFNDSDGLQRIPKLSPYFLLYSDFFGTKPHKTSTKNTGIFSSEVEQERPSLYCTGGISDKIRPFERKNIKWRKALFFL